MIEMKKLKEKLEEMKGIFIRHCDRKEIGDDGVPMCLEYKNKRGDKHCFCEWDNCPLLVSVEHTECLKCNGTKTIHTSIEGYPELGDINAEPCDCVVEEADELQVAKNKLERIEEILNMHYNDNKYKIGDINKIIKENIK